MITCDETIKETKTWATNFNGKKVASKTKKFYILLAFLLITIALLITVTINCCLIKYKSKQNILLAFRVTSHELETFC